jgi:hypothetical protein
MRARLPVPLVLFSVSLLDISISGTEIKTTESSKGFYSPGKP